MMNSSDVNTEIINEIKLSELYIDNLRAIQAALILGNGATKLVIAQYSVITSLAHHSICAS